METFVELQSFFNRNFVLRSVVNRKQENSEKEDEKTAAASGVRQQRRRRKAKMDEDQTRDEEKWKMTKASGSQESLTKQIERESEKSITSFPALGFFFVAAKRKSKKAKRKRAKVKLTKCYL
jgi:hypothetical protein